MGEIVIEMLDEAIDAFINRDPEIAKQVAKKDDVLDTITLI